MSTKRRAPYQHRDGSNCWTKDCSKNVLATEIFVKPSLVQQINQAKTLVEQQKEEAFAKIKTEQVSGWKELGFQHPMAYRHFKRSYRSHNKELVASMTDNLSLEHLQALMYYTNKGYRQINDYLYGKEVDFSISNERWNQPEIDFESYREDLKWRRGFSGKNMILNKNDMIDLVSTMDSALNSVHSDGQQILYRGLKRRNINLSSTEELHEYIDDRYKVGEEVSFKGYLSTTTNPSVGLNFGSPAGPTNLRNEGIFFELKTSRGVDIAPINAATVRHDEEEWLLPRNTRWRIAAVHKSTRITTKDDALYGVKQFIPATLVQLVELD